jgi:spermidine synthase
MRLTLSPCHLVTLSLLCAFASLPLCVSAAQPPSKQTTGTLEHEEKSEYSHIRVRKRGDIRTLCFVRDNGTELRQTEVNLKKRHEAISLYSQAMYGSYLFQPEQKRALIIGLGGGAMVHFLKHHDKELKIDGVEIDPAVVKVADKFFGVRTEGNIRVFTADGFKYLAETAEKYDVIYMDAYLKPSADTDSTGLPLRLKTIEFFKSIQDKLAPGGLVAFNLNNHDQRPDDIQNIKDAFPQVYVLRSPRTNNVVVHSATAKERVSVEMLRARAKELDKRFRANFSFLNLVKAIDAQEK